MFFIATSALNTGVRSHFPYKLVLHHPLCTHCTMAWQAPASVGRFHPPRCALLQRSLAFRMQENLAPNSKVI